MSVLVTVEDIRACNYCTKGTRAWFKIYGLDWSKFVFEGLPIEAFEGIEDAQLQKAIEAAIAREGSK